MLGHFTGSEMEDDYQLNERLWSGHVCPESPLVGRTLSEAGIGHRWGVTVAVLQRGREHCLVPESDLEIKAADDLLLVGREEKVCQLWDLGLEIFPAKPDGHLSTRGVTFAEAVLAPHSHFEGKTLKELDFRRRFSITVVAIKRQHRNYRTEIGDMPLQLGDALLVTGRHRNLKALNNSDDLILIEADPGDQPVNRQAALPAGLVILAAIGASIAGAPVYLSVLSGALLLLLF